MKTFRPIGINQKLMIFLTLCLAGCQGKQMQAHATTAPGGTLLSTDFSDFKSWAKMAALPSPTHDNVTLSAGPVGTFDTADSTSASGGLIFTAASHAGQDVGADGFVSGKLAVKTSETNLDKLTLSFSLSASSTRPVRVGIGSFDAKGNRTGGLEAFIYPAAPSFYQRYAIDLSTMTSVGNGKFNPTSPFVQFAFSAASLPAGYAPQPNYELRLDNVNYASAAYYVSPNGSDTNDGRSDTSAFATPQKALDVAQPGDIVLLMDGTYNAGQVPVASFRRAGQPDAWIVLKNYPGQHPTLSSTGWNIVDVSQGSKAAPSTAPALAYLEIRGLHIRGEGDVAKQKYPDAMDKSDSRTNSNGIAVDGRYAGATIHDIRIADDFVEYAPGCGIGAIDADWVTVENNVCKSNCWTTIYAPSGISVMGSSNFDANVNIYKRLVRNNVCAHNQTYEIWEAVHHYSDGNGIILDVNQGSDASRPTVNYIGRTLVQGNLSYDNGGSGIHTVQADRVDIINNTVYHNSASVHLEYPEMFTYSSVDVHFINNILVAPVANIAAGEKPETINGMSGPKKTNVTFSHNVYFGGNAPPIMGDGDVVADPQFVNASIDDSVADFHLKPGAPGIGKGVVTPFMPLLDLTGKVRLIPPAEGAYEK